MRYRLIFSALTFYISVNTFSFKSTKHLQNESDPLPITKGKKISLYFMGR